MSDEATEAAAIVSDLVQAFVGSVQHLYDSVRESDGAFGVDDALRETSNFIRQAMPVAERGVGLALELLRPWSEAYNARMPGA